MAHKAELALAKKNAVSSVANVMALLTLKECGQAIPEDLDKGLKHFHDCLNKFTGKSGQPQFNWKQELDCFVGCWTKLASNSSENIPDTEMTFEQLGERVSTQLQNGGYPDVISANTARGKSGRVRERKPRKDKEAAETTEQPVAEAVHEEPTPAEDPAVVEEPTHTVVQEEQQAVETPAVEDEEAAHEENA